MSNTPVNTPDFAGQGQILAEYAKLVWTTADTLRGAGFKESDWPKFMMPFFALVLVESRMLRARSTALAAFKAADVVLDLQDPQCRQDFLDEYSRHASSASGIGAGMHDDLVFHGQNLSHIVASAAPASFKSALDTYLAGFDPETRRLLGTNYADGESHYLDIRGAIGQMEGKTHKPLLAYARKWAEMDLTQFDSSAVTMVEEHLKRKWADISAETSGEQYTPRDLIELVAELIRSHLMRHPVTSGTLDIYDPTCGGGNMLFGVETILREALQSPHAERGLSCNGQPYSINTYGQELNDQLFALASIEARFRPSATIREGNTLTNDQFEGQQFDIIVANPPYGVDWKDSKDAIYADQSGRFDPRCMPPTSDGQQLFLQHIFSHLKDQGIALVFCSGSTLFSGDAGGGESNARSKFTLTDDGVHGILQMPKNEFFNTGISTYLWFFWKGKRNTKATRLLQKMFLLNAENAFTKLRKSLGSKNSEIPPIHKNGISDLVDAYSRQADIMVGQALCLISLEEGEVRPTVKLQPVNATGECLAELRAMQVEALHYNKVTLELTKKDPEHGGLSDAIKLNGVSVFAVDDGGVERRVAVTGNDTDASVAIMVNDPDCGGPVSEDPKSKLTSQVLAYVKNVITSGAQVVIRDTKNDAPLYFWSATDRLARSADGQVLGRANLSVVGKWKIEKSAETAVLRMDVSFEPDKEKDTETTPFFSDPAKNKEAIQEFLTKWVRDPYEIRDEPRVGCEINFNRLFPKGVSLRSTSAIMKELATIDVAMTALDNSAAVVKKS